MDRLKQVGLDIAAFFVGPFTVDQALSVFTKVVDNLMAIKVKKQEESRTINEEIVVLAGKADEADAEANRAEALAEKIRGLLR